MTRQIFTLLGILSAFVFSACGEDAFSQISTIDLPEHEPLPVISLHLIGGDTIIQPAIDLSKSIIDNDARPARSATLRLFENGQERVAFENTEVGNNEPELLNYQGPSFSNVAGATFMLTGEVEGIQQLAMATQVMPSRPVVENLEFTPEGGIDIDGDRLDEVAFDLIDPAGEENYYAFQVVRFQQTTDSCREEMGTFVCDTIFVRRSRSLSTNDPLILENARIGLSLTDDAFNGSRYRVRLLVSGGSNETTPLSLRVLSLSEDGYRYLRSYTAYEDGRFDPFSEPVNVHDNIENGYGYFMVSNLLEIIIQ